MLLCKGILIFLAYLISYYAYGLLFVRLFKIRGKSLTFVLLSGLFFYSTVFLAYVLIPKYMRVPLSQISLIWGIFWATSVIFLLAFFRKESVRILRETGDFIRNNIGNSLLVAAFTVGQCVFNGMYGRWSSSNNPSEYVAYVPTAIFTNELGTTDPRTGLLRSAFEVRLFTQSMLDHSAVVSKLFKIHPLIEIRWVTPFILFILGSLIIYLLAREIFSEKSKQWLFFAVYQAAVMLTADSYLTGSFYIYFRNYEGKNIMSALVIPILLYVFWKLYKDPWDRDALALGLITVIGSFAFSGSALFMTPVMELGLIPAVLSKKTLKRILYDAFLLLLPCAIYAVYYLGCIQFHFINLPIR